MLGYWWPPYWAVVTSLFGLFLTRIRETLASRKAGSAGEPGQPVSDATQGYLRYVEEVQGRVTP